MTYHQSKGLKRRIKQHIKAGTHSFYAIVLPGFENTALNEILSLNIGTSHKIETGGISFRGDIDDCIKINLACRTITRCLMRIGSFTVYHFNTLRQRTAQIPWELYLNPEVPLLITVSSEKSKLYHRERIKQEVFSGITERFEKADLKPFPIPWTKTSTEESQKIFVRAKGDQFMFSLDSSGDPLYKRGIKTKINPAPLRETTAAAILQETGITDYDYILDPFCGSGTFSIEALLRLSGTMPGARRTFSFMKWPVFSAPHYEYLYKSLEKKLKRTIQESIQIISSDIDPEAVKICKENMLSLSATGKIEQRDFLKNPIPVPKNKRCVLFANPPYGKRLSPCQKDIYEKLGRVINTCYQKCSYAIICPDKSSIKALSLPFDKTIKFSHGGIRVFVIIKKDF